MSFREAFLDGFARGVVSGFFAIIRAGICFAIVAVLGGPLWAAAGMAFLAFCSND